MIKFIKENKILTLLYIILIYSVVNMIFDDNIQKLLIHGFTATMAYVGIFGMLNAKSVHSNCRGFEIVSSYKDKNIHLPQRKTAYSAGYDIESAIDITLEPHKVTVIPTGIKAYMQEDEYLGLYIRSGISIKNNLSIPNSCGIIDADFFNNPDNEGHFMIAILNNNDTPFEVTKGMRIAQGIFYKYLTVDNDNAKGERKGGMGSTGM